MSNACHTETEYPQNGVLGKKADDLLSQGQLYSIWELEHDFTSKDQAELELSEARVIFFLAS